MLHNVKEQFVLCSWCSVCHFKKQGKSLWSIDPWSNYKTALGALLLLSLTENFEPFVTCAYLFKQLQWIASCNSRDTQKPEHLYVELCADVIVSEAKKKSAAAAARRNSLIAHTCFKRFSAKNFCYQRMHSEKTKLLFLWLPGIINFEKILQKQAFSNKRLQNQAGWSSDSKFKYQQQLMNSRCLLTILKSAINWVTMVWVDFASKRR